MLIAFTHNLQLRDSEEEAEFDRPETVSAISEALSRLGHHVEPLEVSGTASRVVARLEALNPDLVFNTAEGTQGRMREAFYPALFDRLGIPFTGSDAYVCMLTLDKYLTKMVVAAHGVPTPKSLFVTHVGQLSPLALKFPLIVKPNFEGSSMGITRESVVESEKALKDRVAQLLSRYPEGLLVEEFIVGRDIVVPFLEKASPETEGVLEPATYHFEVDASDESKYMVYDYSLKGAKAHQVHVQVPAAITGQQHTELIRLSQITFRALGVKDIGRIDFRIDEKGNIYFIEVNALPSLEEGASLYLSADLIGLSSMDAVLGTVVESAAKRYGIEFSVPKKKDRKETRSLTIGLTFNLRRTHTLSSDQDEDAEYDRPETIAAIRQAIASYGHRVVELEATPDLPAILPAASVDLVFNIAEGFKGRNRESQIPALLELLGIPYTGSDPAALSLALDKGLAKRLVREAGFKTPAFVLMTTGRERLPADFSFPAIVKPVSEGSSKGILKSSVVENEDELRELAQDVAFRYNQAVIAESYLSGREFTVGLLGERRPRVLPPMEIIFTDQSQYPVYSFASKFNINDIRFEVPAKVSPELEREISRVARGVFTTLGCRDVARVDLRLDADGNVNFIECNPLPGLTPDFSDLCTIAKAAGMDYRTLIGEILAPAVRRLKENRKELRTARPTLSSREMKNRQKKQNNIKLAEPKNTSKVDAKYVA